MLFEAAFCTVIVIALWKTFRNRNRPKFSISSVLTYRIYNIFRRVLTRSGRESVWELLNVDILHLFSSMEALFPEEKIIDISVGFSHFALLTKAESIEEFLMSKVQTSRLKEGLMFPWFGNSFALKYGLERKVKKKVIMPMYRQDAAQMTLRFNKHAKVLVNTLKQKQNEEYLGIEELMGHCSLDCIFETALGVNLDVQSFNNLEYLSGTRRVASTLIRRLFNPIFYYDFVFRKTALGLQFENDIRYLREFVQQVIRKRRATRSMQNVEEDMSQDHKKTKHQDLLNIILDAHQQNTKFSEEDAIDEIAGFIFAGHDTTAAAMSWAFYLIGLHTEVQTKIHEELDSIFEGDNNHLLTAADLVKMEYLECVLKESQRIYPSVPMNARQALEDFVLCGRKIKKGTFIIVSHYHLHRNPEVFPNPEKFDPDRFLPQNCQTRSPTAYIPFSIGDRSCLGRRIAMIEQKVILANVLRHFSVKSLDPRDKLRLTTDFTLHSTDALKLKFCQRYPNVN